MKANPVWTSARDDLLKATTDLGYPEELRHEIVRNFGWLKAMQRMTAYLRYVKPNRPELVVDEMLAIRLEILIWQEKRRVKRRNMQAPDKRGKS